MRVVLFAKLFPKESETFIAQKFVSLVDSGVDVHLACALWDQRSWQEMAVLSSRPELLERVHVLGTGRTARGVLRSARAVGLALVDQPRACVGYGAACVTDAGPRGLRTAIAHAPLISLRPDLVHFEFANHARDRTRFIEAAPFPVTVSVRGYDVNAAGLDEPDFYAALWRSIDGVHTLGEDLWRRAIQRGCPEDLPHRFIPPAVDTSRFVPVPRSPVAVGTAARPLRILTVARLHWKKGVTYGLRAVRELLDRGLAVEYRVLGDGDDADEVEAAIRDLDLGGTVELAGWRPHDEVQAAMQWADVMMHPAVSEGFCNAVMEAQAMELAVVCTDADGLRENVVDGETGFVVPRRDPLALADRIALLAEDPRLRLRLGAAGRRRVAECFDPDAQIAAFVSFFEDAMGTGRLHRSG